MSCIWHGFNLDPRKRRKQCYYEWHCLVCWLRTVAFVVHSGLKHRLNYPRVNGQKMRVSFTSLTCVPMKENLGSSRSI